MRCFSPPALPPPPPPPFPPPPRLRRYLGFLTWMGDISLGRILPVGCDRPLEPYQRLVAEGLMPVLIIVAGTAVSVILGGARYLRRRRRKRRKTVRTVLMHELKRVLPWLLPFSYLCSTSMATQAFSVYCASGTSRATER